MKKPMMKLATLVGAALALTCGAANAESQYGYDASGGISSTAQARLNVTVKIPNLLLLRVGADGATVDTATLAATISGIPGGVSSPLTAGSNNPSAWNGSAPTLAASSSGNVVATAWTNSPLGGSVTAAGTGFSSLPPAAVTVASTPIGSTGLAHPGLNLGTPATSTFPRNTVASSNWVFSVSAAALAAAAAGDQTQVMTYTATAL